MGASTRLIRRGAPAGSLAMAAMAGALLWGAASATAAEVVVRPSSMDGWAAQINKPTGEPTASETAPCHGAVNFVSGPAEPPLGAGSAELKVAGGEGETACAAQLRNSSYGGVKLSEVTTLEYWTYVKKNNGSQAPYLELYLNLNGEAHGMPEEEIFFEPPYQTPTSGNPSLPNQGEVVYDKWQKWNATEGGWWSNGEENAGTGVEPLSYYRTKYPNAVIVNSKPGEFGGGGGGITLAVGYAEEVEFASNVDAVTIGDTAGTTVYNFEAPQTCTATPPAPGKPPAPPCPPSPPGPPAPPPGPPAPPPGPPAPPPGPPAPPPGPPAPPPGPPAPPPGPPIPPAPPGPPH